MTSKAAVVLIYAFSAWLSAAFCVYAASRLFSGQAHTAFRCAAIAACFCAAFRLYFSRPGGLPPPAAAALCVALVAALDWAIVAARLPRPALFFLSFWDWQLPAGLVFGSVLVSGASKH